MPADPVRPALKPLIHALARAMVSQEQREATEAAPQMAALRAALREDADAAAWKRRAEGLMQAFYEQASNALDFKLSERLKFVTAAVEELGPGTSDRELALHAAQLASAAGSLTRLTGFGGGA